MYLRSVLYITTVILFLLKLNAEGVPLRPNEADNDAGFGFNTLNEQEGDAFSGSFTDLKRLDTLFFVLVESTDVTCKGFNDGRLVASGQGGVPPYSYEWHLPGGDIYYGNTIVGLSSGVYSLVARDSLNSVAEKTVVIHEPAPLVTSVLVQDVTCIDANNGVITGEVAGGTPPYSFYFDSIYMPEFLMTGLSKGDYYIRISDNNGCETGNLVYVSEIPVECLRIPNAFTPNGDGVNDEWVIENIEMFDSWRVIVYNGWGQIVYLGSPGSEPWNAQSDTGNLVPAGSYMYVVESHQLPKAKCGVVTVVY